MVTMAAPASMLTFVTTPNTIILWVAEKVTSGTSLFLDFTALKKRSSLSIFYIYEHFNPRFHLFNRLKSLKNVFFIYKTRFFIKVVATTRYILFLFYVSKQG